MQYARSSNLRKGRQSLDGQIYLVTTCTALRCPHFASPAAGRCVVQALMETNSARTLAFVVMPDHLHWLMALKAGATLSTTVQFLKSGSARRFNALRGRDGRVWQQGFHDHALRRDEDIRRYARYIIANPLRAGLVSHIGDYPLWDAIYL